MQNIFNIFSVHLRNLLMNANIEYEKLKELRLRTGQPFVIEYGDKEYFISENAQLINSDGQDKNIEEKLNLHRITPKEISETVAYISRYSLYAFEEEIKQGYITVPGGHRVGICGMTIMECGKIKTMRYISFINIRVAHEVRHCSDPLMKYIYKNENTVNNTLIISPPMRGKTTILRDIVRNLSNGFEINGTKKVRGINVGLADERSEIAAAYLGIPQNDVGIRTDVLDAVPKIYGIMMLIRTMSPKVIAVDEIGSEKDIEAVLYGINCGCGFMATVHGESIDDIRNKKAMNRLIEDKVFNRYFILEKGEDEKRYVTVFNEELKKMGVESI